MEKVSENFCVFNIPETVNGRKVVVKKASKSAGEKLGNAVEDAKDMATGYLVTRTIDKAADRRLQKKQEKNRHQEEMARIRRGS